MVAFPVTTVLDKTTDNPYLRRVGPFEWDRAKANANWRRHGVTFEQATKAFQDPRSIEHIDNRQDYGEERINLIGASEGALLHVTYTERDGRIRLISARRAVRHEQDRYYRENSF
jgi:uncharacterized protein